MNILYLKRGKEKIITQRHPWIFSGAVERVEGNPQNGETVEVRDSSDRFLALGAYSPNSQIRVRIWSFGSEEIDLAFFRHRIRLAIDRRNGLRSGKKTNAYRLIHGESDRLPGLIVDQYGDFLAVQVLSSGAEFYLSTLVDAISQETGIENIFERSDVEVRKLEGLPMRKSVLKGSIPEEIQIEEADYQFVVGLESGQKTGYYLDQRENRSLVGRYCKGKDVLDCFSFTGGFSVYALGNGAEHVTSVDSSQDALELAKRHVELNGFDINKHEVVQGDVFQLLRKFRDMGRSFDVIVLDPPKFAPTAAQVKRAARAYKDINLLAFKLLRAGGYLATFSCSGGITEQLFQKIVADAALDAGVHAAILHWMRQSADHPVGLNFPEGAYLKGLICKVD